MRHSLLVAMMLVAVSAIGCQRSRAAVRPTAAAVPTSWEHCWWAVLRTVLPPDSVAVRFHRGFSAAGLSGGTWTQRADTAWAHAGPLALGAGTAAMTYESRAVAYRRGDSTHFRYYVGNTRNAAGASRPTDSLELGRRRIALCAEIARGAAIPMSVPRAPTGEEALDVWTRIP